MLAKTHHLEEIIGKLREAEIMLTQGAKTADIWLPHADNLANPITMRDVYAYGGATLRA